MTKYYYAIVNKENAELYIDSGRLPIYFTKRTAQNVVDNYHIDKRIWTIQPIRIDGLEKLILKGKRDVSDYAIPAHI